MAIYLVGDVQGCLRELKALLAKIHFNPAHDQLWLAGDIIARGPDSLDTLRFIKSLGDSAKMVLGNHDLHLLAIHAGLKKANPKDNLSALLNATDITELTDWLAKQPLIRQLPDENAFISHAGISPQWTIEQALEQAAAAQQKLSSASRNSWLALMYGNSPNNWHQANTEIEKFRYTINAFTRMRFCNQDLSLEFDCKEEPQLAPANIIPWYQLSKTVEQTSWLFGHWASLMGNCPQPNVYALDTGCVWGNHLTILRWHDKKIFTQASTLGL